MSPKLILFAIKTVIGLIITLIIGMLVKSETILKDAVERRFGQN